MSTYPFVTVAWDLEEAGLVWQPEIGDEVAPRNGETKISILVDPHGLGPAELRETYLWLPNLEQLVLQLEARQAVLFHVGLEFSNTALCYKAVVQARASQYETSAESPRIAVGLALRDMLISSPSGFH